MPPTTEHLYQHPDRERKSAKRKPGGVATKRDMPCWHRAARCCALLLASSATPSAFRAAATYHATPLIAMARPGALSKTGKAGSRAGAIRRDLRASPGRRSPPTQKAGLVAAPLPTSFHFPEERGRIDEFIWNVPPVHFYAQKITCHSPRSEKEQAHHQFISSSIIRPVGSTILYLDAGDLLFCWPTVWAIARNFLPRWDRMVIATAGVRCQYASFI